MNQNKLLAFLVFLVLLPQFIMATSFSSFLLIALLGVFQFLVVRASKVIFFIFLLYLSIINQIMINISIHWGGYANDIASRIGVALQSPQSETVEYLKEYVGIVDFSVLIVSTSLLIVTTIFLVSYVKPKIGKFTYIFLFIMFIILQNQEPLKVLKYIFKTAEINSAISKRSELLNIYEPSVNKKYLGLYDKVIIVQGESANKSFLGIYNRDLNTTPYLQFLKNEGSLYSYNIISPTNQTRYSVPTTFTNANVLNWYEGYQNSLSIITDFKENTYTSYWLSTQGRRGLHEDSVTSIAKEADIVRFFKGSKKKDAVLLEFLENNLNVQNERELYIFHIMGSHFRYEERYPLKNLNFQREELVEDRYKNSIYFTDYLLKKILSYFDTKNEKVLLVYLSDHGEVVSETKHGHGYFPSYKEEYEIPFCVYSSIKNARLEELLDDNKRGYFNAENMNNYIKYISGLSNEKNISYSSKVFSLDPKNIIDYRKLPRYEKK